jgi:DNA-binding response OmpR family regulator
MDESESIFPDPDILWSQIREAERAAPDDRPVVLVVEDDPSTRILMRYALRDVVRTDAASTVADALRMAETVPYDGLLVDLRLPDGEGTEVVNQLREQTPYWGVPMVAVTAHGLPEGTGHFLDAGFDAYLAKPFEQDELRTLVRHLVMESDEAVDKGRKLVREEDAAQKLSRDEPEEERRGTRQEAPATRRLDLPPDA